IVAGIQEWRVRQEASRVQSTVNVVSASDSLQATVQQLEAAQLERDSTIALITSPSVIPIDLINYSATAPLARMYWDPESHGWLLYTYNVREPREGKIFQVWLYSTNNSAPVSLGTMTPTNNRSP